MHIKQVHGKPATPCVSPIPCAIQQSLLQPPTPSHIFATAACLPAQATVEVVEAEAASLEVTKQSRQLSTGGDLIAPSHAHTFSFRREKERKGQQHKGRSLRRESQKGIGRISERPQKVNQKERWVEDSLSLLKPPPAFPVQDSPAKLQPAVSYASKVKAGPASGGLEEDRPAIGVLLQNQWGLSFISEARPATDVSGPRPAASALPPQPTDAEQSADLQFETVLTVQPPEDTPTPVATSGTPTTCPEVDASNGKLLLSCRHLVEALNYHSREWNAICNKQKKSSKKGRLVQGHPGAPSLAV